jgi:hypothetical protein
MILRFGNTRVPVTSSWASEEHFFLERCRWFGGIAICQHDDTGPVAARGKPLFSKPHMQRQRRAMALGLCDICGRTLRTSTKVSLSHARPQPHGADGWAILQVEPMMHRACALEAVDQCPSLKRDVLADTLRIRQVLRWRAQCAVMDADYVQTITGQHTQALGHGKIELLEWQDRDADWLLRCAKVAA